MSVTHVVLVEWIPGGDRSAHAAELVDRHLPRIPGITKVSRGASISPEGLEGGFDWTLVVTFSSVDARDAYLPHPEHEPVASYLGGNAARIVVFDLVD